MEYSFILFKEINQVLLSSVMHFYYIYHTEKNCVCVCVCVCVSVCMCACVMGHREVEDNLQESVLSIYLESHRR